MLLCIETTVGITYDIRNILQGELRPLIYHANSVGVKSIFLSRSQIMIRLMFAKGG